MGANTNIKFRHGRPAALIAGITGIVALFAWYAHTVWTPVPPRPAPAVTRGDLYGARSPAPAGEPLAESPPKTASAALDYKKSYARARDYWTFAHQALHAARAGNADAQFYLSRVLERCDEDNRMYFQRRGQRISLDEGLQLAVKRHLSIEVAQSVFEKCHEFQEHDVADLGGSADWLAKATAAGQPLAQATTAEKMLMQDAQQSFAQAAGVPNPSTQPRIENASDPRLLLREALKSKDPEVLFNIGEAQGLLNPASSDTNMKRIAWLLVACERGFDCSENADWVKNSCGDNADCASVGDPSERVRRLAGDQWPEVQQLAQDIGIKLDAGKLDELGLGSSAVATAVN